MITCLKTSYAVRVFGTAAVMLSMRVVGTLLTLSYTLFMVAVAAPDDVGRAFAALSAGFLLSVLASLNVEAGSIRFLPLYFEAERKADAAGYVKWCRRTVLVVCATVIAPALAVLVWLYGFVAMGPFLLSFAAAPIMANARINSRQGVALGLVLRASLPRILVRPVVMTAYLGAATMFGWTLTATEIMGGLFVAACLETGVQWALIRRALAFRHDVVARFDQAREWVPFGLLLTPTLVMTEYMRDVIIISAGFTLMHSDVARLGLSLSMISILNFALNSVDIAFSPKISRATAQGSPQRRARLLTMCGIGKLGVLLLGVPLTWLLLPFVLNVLGADYAGIENMFLVLVLIPMARAVFGPANLVLNITGHKAELFWCALAGLGAIVLGVFLGQAVAQTPGVIMGIALAVASYQALLFTTCRWRTGIDTTALSLMWERRSLRECAP